MSGATQATQAKVTRVAEVSNVAPELPSRLATTWLIGKRAAIESLYDPMTIFANGIFALIIPILVVVGQVAPAAAHATTPGGRILLGNVLATYLLIVGLLPASGSVGIAAGVFAGEKEHGNLTPLLASPASNLAIFLGKALGAVLPTLGDAVLAISAYLVEVIVVIGSGKLALLPLGLALVMLALVPCVSVFGAAVASVISSRVRTYNMATTYSSLALVPVSGVLLGLAFTMPVWAGWARWLAVLAMLMVDAGIVLLGAATWKREEVLAKR